MSTLTEFLKQQKEAETAQLSEAPCRRDEWLGIIGKLFDQIQRWVAEAQKADLITVTPGQVDITEDSLGKYQAPTLLLRTTSGRVLVRPVGRGIIGFNGRVDLESPKGTITLLYSAAEDRWVTSQGRDPLRFPQLTEASFTDMLTTLL